jgi:hypothetical protein
MSMFGDVARVRSEEVLMESSWCVGLGGRRVGLLLWVGEGWRISVMLRMWWRECETCLMAMKVKTPEWWG